jgi:hypothetical protein
MYRGWVVLVEAVDQQHEALAAGRQRALGRAQKRRRQPRRRGQPRVGLRFGRVGTRASICATSEPTSASRSSQFAQPQRMK